MDIEKIIGYSENLEFNFDMREIKIEIFKSKGQTV